MNSKDKNNHWWKSKYSKVRVYYFGHLKSAKASENGRLRGEKFQLPTKIWEF